MEHIVHVQEQLGEGLNTYRQGRGSLLTVVLAFLPWSEGGSKLEFCWTISVPLEP